MSSGNDQQQKNTSTGLSVMEVSETPADGQESSDSSTRAKTDSQNQNENNSSMSSPKDDSSNDHTVQIDASSSTAMDIDDRSEADNGAESTRKEPSVIAMEESSSISDSMPNGQTNIESPQPIIQPETVELPPLNQTVLPESDQADEKVQDGGSSDKIASNVVELPPLEQSAATSEPSASTSGAKDENSGQSVYYIKWIHYKQNKVPIITQNENGPCPLLAIMNVLLLKGKVKLAPMIEMITSEQLMTYLGECILDSMPENLSESVRANYEQNMQDAMSVMYKLQTGLDVNVKFTGVDDFEYTPECIIFDLLQIPLYHGWLVDPQDLVCTSAVGTCSYNQLVEKIIAQKSSEKEEDVTEALVAEQFLDRTASQLTYYGLCELSTTVKEGELCVFFRNNHFSTLYRVDNELFLLVTDQGFLTETNVVWETLSNVEGDCHFVDTNFRTYTKPEPSSGNIASSPVPVGSDQQIDQDYQVALSLQQESEISEEQETAWGQMTQESSALQMADHELARRLQEEEDRRAAAAVNASQQRAAAQQQAQGQGNGGQGQPQQPAAHSSNSRNRGERPREEKKDCRIL